jgi:hypothetical protein
VADIRVHYAWKNAARRGSRRSRADHDVVLGRVHNSEHNHAWRAFRKIFHPVQGKKPDEQGCCLMADREQSKEIEVPDHSGIDERTRSS